MKKQPVLQFLFVGLAAACLIGCGTKTQDTAGTKSALETEREASPEEPKERFSASDKQWSFAYFGTSTSKSSNTMKEGGSLENGISLTSCTVKEDGTIDKKGGKFAAGEGYDGISFYYTAIDPETENFTLKADVTIDYINPNPDGQEGVALLARDSLGENGVTDCAFFTNSAAVIGSKLTYEEESGEKISIKDGIGYRMITGVDSDTRPPSVETLTLDSLAFTPDIRLTEGDTYTFELSKTNTGYHAAYYDENGEKKEQILYGPEELAKIDEDNVYIGFAAARGCNATFKNIAFEVRDAASDPAPEKRPVKETDSDLQILSSDTTGLSQYPLTFKATADGTAVIRGKNGEALSEEIKVKANKIVTKPCQTVLGDNTFTIEFTPEEGFMIDEYTKLSSYETRSYEFGVNCRILEGDRIYVSPGGSKSGRGSQDSPVDLSTAFQFVRPGQTILLSGGTYEIKEGLKIPRGVSGTEEEPVVMKTEAGEKAAILDFKKEGNGLEIWGDYWRISNMEVCNTADGAPGIRLSGSHNLLEQIKTYDNGNTGLQISGTSEETIEMWPSHNTILNCTSYNNCDAAMEDADGFAAKLTCGEGNLFKGCIAAYNADDGWDLFAKIATGRIGAVTIEDSVAFKNGYIYDESGNVTEAGNGNGFKMGGSGINGRHVLKNSISYENKAKGIDSNSCPDIELFNNISFQNGGANIALYTTNKADTAFVAEHNISFGTKEKKPDDLQLKGQDESLIYSEDNYFYEEASEAYQNSRGDEITEEMFVSLDTSLLPERNEDGTIDLHGLLERK